MPVAPRTASVLVALIGMLATLPSAARGATHGDCGWTTAGSGGPTAPVMHQAFPSADTSYVNVLLGERSAHYWQSFLRPPTGGYIEYKGQFPHARYLSFSTYGGGIRSVDGVYDAIIEPDPGSSNPFLEGADRRTPNRDYTVRLVAGRVPAEGRARNTFYTTNADGSNSAFAGAPTVSMRIYAPDRGRGPTGGVPLPTITKVHADGTRETLPPCPKGGLPDLGTDTTLANAGIGERWPENVVPGSSNPPVWEKFEGYGSLTGTNLTGGSGGFGDNPDQKYVYTNYRAKFGQVLAFRGKAPTAPKTWDDVAVMGSGQVRFWSICTYATTTQGYDCQYDEHIPVDKHGYYTVVLSTAAARPDNATTACGALWLPTGPTDRAIVILRNLLPAPTFAEATHNVETGKALETMGEYYPHGTYYETTLDFERLGCNFDGGKKDRAPRGPKR